MYQSIPSFEPLFLFRLSHLSTQFLCLLTCLILVESLIICLTVHLVSEFLGFCTFWDVVEAGYRE